MTTTSLTIGQLAAAADVHIETLRYYERRGLVPAPPRDGSSNYRRYPTVTVTRVQFIKRAQGLGFSLQEIADLLNLNPETSATCEEVCDRSREKINEIQIKIAELEVMKLALEQLVTDCSGRPVRDGCHILKYFGGESSE